MPAQMARLLTKGTAGSGKLFGFPRGGRHCTLASMSHFPAGWARWAIDIEHEETCRSRFIQMRSAGRMWKGWDPAASGAAVEGLIPTQNQGLQAAGSQNVTVTRNRIVWGTIEPADLRVVIRRWLQSGLQWPVQTAPEGRCPWFPLGNMGHGKHSLS